MSTDYPTLVNQVANMMPATSTDAGFQTMLPGAIDYAEGRLYRELDLVATTITDGSASVTANTRNLTLPAPTAGAFRIVESLNIITPSTAVYPAGTRHPVQFVSKSFLDTVYANQSSGTGIPKFAYRLDEDVVILGPSPDLNYPVEVTGTYRPAALSSANSSTFLTKLVPELFTAAVMVYASAWMRDFGAQSDDPAKAQSWESTYKTLFESANVEELCKQYMSQGWTSQQPNQVATPPRV